MYILFDIFDYVCFMFVDERIGKFLPMPIYHMIPVHHGVPFSCRKGLLELSTQV